MFDCIVVGSGFCGSVIARRLAEECGKKVLVLERRNVVSGNMYDELDGNSILYQKYGPHIFHTNNKEVFDYLCRFSRFTDYNLKCEAVIDGVPVPSPFNFKTIDLLYDGDHAKALKSRILQKYPGSDKVTIIELMNSDDALILEYANMLFEKDYRLYTSKQWGIPPEEIDVSVLKRVPVLTTYKEAYFDDKYQGMPKEGFHSLFKRLLDHKNITVKLETDALKIIEVDIQNQCVYVDGERTQLPVVFTGAIDELLEYRFGQLPYRSLTFEYKLINKRDFQNVAVVAYPQEKGFTRITEYTKLPYQDVGDKTLIAIEYPLQYNKSEINAADPYYPIVNHKNQLDYNQYREVIENIRNLYPCGRLADYKYYNMDDAILRAFKVFEEIASKY